MGDTLTTPTNLHEAILALQANLPEVEKTQEADAGKYKYNYADLRQVSNAILPLLNPLGLTWVTMPNVGDHGFGLHYTLRHASGEALEGFYPLPDRGSPQDVGAAITYARRYALCAVTGVAPGGDDNDAKQASKTKTVVPDETIAEWLELIKAAGTELELKKVWTDIGHAGLGTERRLLTATNARKRALSV